MLVEVNNKNIKFADSLKTMLNSNNSKTILKFIPILRNEEGGQHLNAARNSIVNTGRKMSQIMDISDGKLKKAQNFYTSVNFCYCVQSYR